jgi:class 3 adenylate cyclase
VFLDVVGSTALGQHLDPQEIGVVIDGPLARGTEIVAMHQGKVMQYAGDNNFTEFGVDEARENDSERADSRAYGADAAAGAPGPV